MGRRYGISFRVFNLIAHERAKRTSEMSSLPKVYLKHFLIDLRVPNFLNQFFCFTV